MRDLPMIKLTAAELATIAPADVMWTHSASASAPTDQCLVDDPASP
jgi:hypothetical protein